MYRIFRRGDGEPAPMRSVIVALVIAAAAIVAAGLFRVSRQHEVLRLGYELSRKTEQVRQLREQQRQLELERATLSAPSRIERLATQLGMAQVPPDRIRIARVATTAEAHPLAPTLGPIAHETLIQPVIQARRARPR